MREPLERHASFEFFSAQSMAYRREGKHPLSAMFVCCKPSLEMSVISNLHSTIFAKIVVALWEGLTGSLLRCKIGLHVQRLQLRFSLRNFPFGVITVAL